jgi:adenylate cyclase class IV
MTEVELRAFVDDQTFGRLLTKFRVEGHKVRPVRQVTYYLDSQVDTRVQISRKSGKLWQKLGKMHETMRTEIEVFLSRKDAKALLQIMANLGFTVKVVWYRERVQFSIGQLTVSLDDTVGYGRILEVEIVCGESEANESRDSLLKFLVGLGVTPSPRDEFDAAYREYVANWRLRTEGLSENWVDEGVA